MKGGAKIYYEDRGGGRVLLLVHGWSCSSRFWRRNAPELAKEFRVITMDLRGHGRSSKILAGHTVDQYARDVREVIEQLGVRDVTLVGWSLAGPVVLSYCRQFASDSRISALGLVDITPFPFSPADWNSHSLKNYNTAGMNAMFRTYTADPLKFLIAYTHNMFKDGKVPEEDRPWVPVEMSGTPPWIATAIYSDYVMSDYTEVLPAIEVPAIVFAADSNVFKKGIEMGRSIAARIPNATFIPFEDAGHLLFYEQPGKFNNALIDFVKGTER
jgi:pimeloyl-ACP methyl ester carboxylesterase